MGLAMKFQENSQVGFEEFIPTSWGGYVRHSGELVGVEDMPYWSTRM